MISRIDQKSLMDALASAFWHTGEEAVSKDIEKLGMRSVEEAVRVLTKIEKTPRLKTELWERVVQAKGVIAGKVEIDTFIIDTQQYIGLR